jgi:nicotinamide/nicotinate riboside kinase
MNRTVLVGISGCTSAGKTTLTNKLISEFLGTSCSINQDEYYFEEKSGQLEYLNDVNYYNYESVSGIDMVKLREDIIKLSTGEKKYKYIILDGFLLYEDDALYKMLDKKYFIHVDEETCRSRRHGRVYSGLYDPPKYFEKYIWPNYLKYREKCETNYNEIVYLDGTFCINYLVNFVKNDIENKSVLESQVDFEIIKNGIFF